VNHHFARRRRADVGNIDGFDEFCRIAECLDWIAFI
jgi:hypothetical protein